jgi:hypothetical protein
MNKNEFYLEDDPRVIVRVECEMRVKRDWLMNIMGKAR